MSLQSPLGTTGSPENDLVVGNFCYPPFVTLPGFVNEAGSVVVGPNTYYKLLGTNCKFTKHNAVGSYIVISFSGYIKVLKVVKVVSDDEVYVDQSIADMGDDRGYNIIRGTVRGVSINCVGAGFVNGTAVEANDVLTYFDENGLKPVYGIALAPGFKIISQ